MSQPRFLWAFNCGGFALRTEEWYQPHNNIYYGYNPRNLIEDIMRTDFYNERENKKEREKLILKYLLDKDINAILDDFPKLQIVKFDKLDYSKKIIAYRIYFEEKDNLDGYDYDFHFKYWNTKSWSEKLGSSIIRHCDLDSNKDWFYDAMDLTNKNKELAERGALL